MENLNFFNTRGHLDHVKALEFLSFLTPELQSMDSLSVQIQIAVIYTFNIERQRETCVLSNFLTANCCLLTLLTLAALIW